MRDHDDSAIPRSPTTRLVEEPEPDLRVGIAATDDDLVAAVGQAEPIGLLEALAECAARDDHAVGLAENCERRRIPHRVRRALPPIAARVIKPQPVDEHT